MTCKPNLQTAFALELAHLIQLAKQPAWKAHAWHRAKELDADTSGLFTGMAEALKSAMNGQAKAAEYAPPTSGKRP